MLIRLQRGYRDYEQVRSRCGNCIFVAYPVGPTVVPPGTVMVMGDNRGNSRDSRTFGFIPEGAIYGHAVRLYYRRGDGFVWKPI